MSRAKRITLGGYVYHVLNRANGRLRIFRKDDDFLAFGHMLLWPREDGDLSEFMRWISLTHRLVIEPLTEAALISSK